MKKRVFTICAVLIAAILVVAMVPGCAPAGEGTIEVKAIDLCVPEAWEGLVTYTLSCEGQADVTGSSVPGSHTVAPGTWNITFDVGGPPNAYVASVTPSASQTVADGGTKTFTFNFDRGLDAEISFVTWTINGVPVESGWAPMPSYNVTWGDVIGLEFQQRVRGCPEIDVTVNETFWMLVYYLVPETPAPNLVGTLHVADNSCAVEKVPTYVEGARTEKLLQQVAMYGADGGWALPLAACTSLNMSDWMLGYFPPVWAQNYSTDYALPSLVLDENSMWGLETGPLYDKTINFLQFGYYVPAPEDCVLFQITIEQPWAVFVLLAGISVDLVDAVDINPANNYWMSYDPPLQVVVLPP